VPLFLFCNLYFVSYCLAVFLVFRKIRKEFVEDEAELSGTLLLDVFVVIMHVQNKVHLICKICS